MTSLTAVYEGRARWIASARRLYLGVGLFAAGAVAIVAGIVLATTSVRTGLGVGLYPARELAGILAGLGVPATFLGVYVVLPADRATAAMALVGTSVAGLGVALFQYAYPFRWISADPALALTTTGVYVFGAITTFASLFVSVATFDTRNDPGGTATMRIIREGTVRIVAAEESLLNFTGIGLFGSDPDGEVDTQTNRDGGPEGVAGDRSGPGWNRERAAISDGGAASTVDTDGHAAIDPAAAEERGKPDTYCGNCAHFKYVREGDRLRPHCGLRSEPMEDMDACDSWESNSAD